MSSKEKALVFGVAHAQIIVFGTTTLASYNPPTRNTEIADNVK
jgi:hypothetical protein